MHKKKPFGEEPKGFFLYGLLYRLPQFGPFLGSKPHAVTFFYSEGFNKLGHLRQSYIDAVAAK